MTTKATFKKLGAPATDSIPCGGGWSLRKGDRVVITKSNTKARVTSNSCHRNGFHYYVEIKTADGREKRLCYTELERRRKSVMDEGREATVFNNGEERSFPAVEDATAFVRRQGFQPVVKAV